MFVGSKVLMLCNFLYFFLEIFSSLCVFSSFIFFGEAENLFSRSRCCNFSSSLPAPPPPLNSNSDDIHHKVKWTHEMWESITISCVVWLVVSGFEKWSKFVVARGRLISSTQIASTVARTRRRQKNNLMKEDRVMYGNWPYELTHHITLDRRVERGPQVILGEVANGKNTFPGLKAELDDFSPSSHLYSISSRHTTNNNSNQRGEEDFLQHFKSFFRFHLTRISTIRLGFNDMC